MAERSLSLPLSMGEVEEAIVVEIRKAFRRDCNFNSALACAWFEASVEMKIKHSDVGREVDTKFDVNVEGGETPAAGSEIVEAKTAFEIGQAPPNRVRVETGQPVPVLTMANGRPEIKRVTYKKPGTFEEKGSR